MNQNTANRFGAITISRKVGLNMFRNADWPGDFVSPAINVITFSEHGPLYSGALTGNDDGHDERFEVDTINISDQSNLACDFINRMYSWRGYGGNHKASTSIFSSTFIASASEEIVGTLTLTIDSPVGLSADKTFGDILDEVRSHPGANLCELTKFASQPSNESRHVLAAMFHTIFIYGSERYNCSDLFIEVNPRHVRFYESMLGFAKVGELRINQAVDAPSQLMRLKVSDIGRYIELYARGGDRVAGHSLYPLFFPKDVQQRVRNRGERPLHAGNRHTDANGELRNLLSKAPAIQPAMRKIAGHLPIKIC